MSLPGEIITKIPEWCGFAGALILGESDENIRTKN